jgi:ribosome biogenesis GTPase / thiamine phosphate phosphatase
MVRHAGAGTLSRPAGRAGFDEDDVRVRPGRSSRPRTRRRPAHRDAAEALVVTVDRGRYGCMLPPGGQDTRHVTAMKARELGRRGVVVGDLVSLAGDVSGEPGTLARIVRITPRSSVLRRSADDADPVERVIVANADQLGIVCALANPPPRTGLIDRFLVAAYDAGLDPLLVLTKADLAQPDGLLAVYAPLGIPHVVTSRPLTEAMTGRLSEVLADRVSVLVGHSGVGKSTLVNTLIPDAGRAVGTVSPVTGRGRHTSSSVVALQIPGGGWIIDTPGLRGFGLGHISPDRVVAAFSDLAEGVASCPPGCSHLAADCALDDWVASHSDSATLTTRLASLRRLLRRGEDVQEPDAPSPRDEPPADPAIEDDTAQPSVEHGPGMGPRGTVARDGGI